MANHLAAHASIIGGHFEIANLLGHTDVSATLLQHIAEIGRNSICSVERLCLCEMWSLAEVWSGLDGQAYTLGTRLLAESDSLLDVDGSVA